MVVHWWSPRTLVPVALTVLFLPIATANPEVRDPSEATVFVDGSADYIEFHEGSLANPAVWTLTAPDGTTAIIARNDPLQSGGIQRWTLGGTHLAGGASWSWAGDLDGAAADGTWTITIPGFYTSQPARLVVQGRSIEFYGHGYTGMGSVQTWNWHMGSWTESHAWTATDLPDESPQEDPQSARFFVASTGGPVGQSIPGDSGSQTAPGQDIDTPPATVPATCTLGPCTTETPIETDDQPVAQTCVPPLVPLFCVGPFTIPAQDLGDAPAICDAAEQACVGPFPVPAQDVVETEAVTVSFEFTGLDAFADLHEVELTSIGPFTQVIPVPLIGDVPVTLCPATCPFPVSPEGETVGSVTVTVTVGDEDESVTIPLGASV